MAFDGFVISNIVSELNKQIIGGRIYKIYQPEADEITLVIKKERMTTRLHLSASASLPLVYLSKEGKANPMQAPNFCMLLRNISAAEGSSRSLSLILSVSLRFRLSIWTNLEISARSV